MNLYPKFCLLNCSHKRWSAVGIMCARLGSIMSALENADKIGRVDLWAIHWLPRLTHRRLLSRDRHVILMRLFGPIRARLTFYGYPRVSMSSSSMLIAATGRCRWLLIWIREFATLKQNQSQHSWRSFTLHICVQTSVTDTGEPLLRNDRAPMTGVSYMQVCAVFLSWYSTPFRAFLEIGVRPGGCYRNCLRYWPIIIWMKMCSAFFLSFFFFARSWNDPF